MSFLLRLLSIWHSFTRNLPVILLILLTIILYYSYVFIFFIPEYQRLHSRWQLSSFIIFHIFFSIQLICLFRLTFTHPGRIPKDNLLWMDCAGVDFSKQIFTDIDKPSLYFNEKDQLCDGDRILSKDELEDLKHRIRAEPIIERKRSITDPHRWCKKCRLYKPDRTHHCRLCNECILQMDHHCLFVAACIGFRNHKFFLLYMFYSVVCCAVIGLSMIPGIIHAFRPIHDLRIFFFQDMIVLLTWLTSIGVGCLVCVFFIHHVKMVINAMTTIELQEKKNDSDKNVVHCFRISHMKYDYGPWNNLKRSLGDRVFLWFLPIFSGKENGTWSSLPETG